MIHPAAAFARELVAALSAHGVGDFVLCPGSRSGPLAHALAEASAESPPIGAPHVNLHVRIDERSAAFLALGIARARALDGKPRPVALVTTSGTAVGNLLPAVMEAHHSGIPLILLTADRPSELRGIGANQTTDQEGIFGQFVRWEAEATAPEKNARPGRATLLAARAVHWALGVPDREDVASAPGPVHLNVEFRDPLGPDAGPWPLVDPEKATLLDRTRSRLRGITLTSRESARCRARHRHRGRRRRRRGAQGRRGARLAPARRADLGRALRRQRVVLLRRDARHPRGPGTRGEGAPSGRHRAADAVAAGAAPHRRRAPALRRGSRCPVARGASARGDGSCPSCPTNGSLQARSTRSGSPRGVRPVPRS